MRNNFLLVIILFLAVWFALGPLLGYIWAEQYPPEVARELAKIHYDRGREYFRNGEYEKAANDFREVLQLQPRHQGARWYLKIADKEQDKYEHTFQGKIEKLKKEKLADKRKEQEKRTEEISDALNLIEQRARNTVLAQEKKQAQLQIPTNQETQPATQLLNGTTVRLIEQQKEQKDLQEIIDLYEQGKAYLQQGLYSEAMNCFDKVIELGGEH
ncbi:MAG: tetratricopeptide repeat protein [Candidatus Omnitrophica bacterium]|nr:tetratricopeptide repeat protein [Candidatus Omnitrophota bacterium]